MRTRIKSAIMAILIAVFCLSFTHACDPSIYDYPGSEGNGYNYLQNVNLRDILDAKKCYEQLLEDIRYMLASCYNTQSLAAMQAYTILMSYSFADMAKTASEYTTEQLATKAKLFDAIKMMNVFSTDMALPDYSIKQYDSTAVYMYANSAFSHCTTMLSYFS